MGLKLKKFKAKLNWKTKEAVSEVVCLRYQMNSEFEEAISPSIPATTSEVTRRLRTSDVIRQKKLAPKLPVQNVFESGTSTNTNINDNRVSHNTEANGSLSNNQGLENTSVATQPRGILKKISQQNPIPEADTKIPMVKQQNYDTKPEDDDDLRKSALIFMTENHDYAEESATSEAKNDADEQQKLSLQQMVKLITANDQTENKGQGTPERRHSNDHESETYDIVELRSHDEAGDASNSDAKTVTFRQTIQYSSDYEIPADENSDMPPQDDAEVTNEQQNSDDTDFKIHFVKHSDLAGEDAESEESSESEDDTKVDTYRNSNAYSSQAASIFFAGEEVEPIPRIRNVAQQQEDTSA